MTMTDRRELDPEGGLDAFFDAARAHPPAPSDAFLERVMADAVAVDAARGQSVAPANPRRGLRDLLSSIGGWPALAGLATATMAGLWIGYAAPDIGSLAFGTGTLAEDGTYDIGGLLPGYVPTDDWSG
jgi:hypothetical protein